MVAESMQDFTVASRLSVRAAMRAVLIASVLWYEYAAVLVASVCVCVAVCLHCCVSALLRLGALAAVCCPLQQRLGSSAEYIDGIILPNSIHSGDTEFRFSLLGAHPHYCPAA